MVVSPRVTEALLLSCDCKCSGSIPQVVVLWSALCNCRFSGSCGLFIARRARVGSFLNSVYAV